MEEVEEEAEEELIEGEGEEVDVDGVEAEPVKDSAMGEEATVQETTSQPAPPDNKKGYDFCSIASVVSHACTIVVRDPNFGLNVTLNYSPGEPNPPASAQEKSAPLPVVVTKEEKKAVSSLSPAEVGR